MKKTKKKILITGGCGYIGSQVAHDLIDQNFDVTIIDNLSTGNKKLAPKKAKLFISDITNKKKIENIFKLKKYDAIFHFAASLNVTESEKKPIKYLKNNCLGTKIILDMIKKFNISKIIFSSTCAVYDEGQNNISENKKIFPKSIYGLTKIQCEKMIKLYAEKFNFKYAILRYFNVIGSDKKLRTGPINKGSLFKNLVTSYLYKKKIYIYGNNFNTRDGTCIRDYIDVNDLSNLHLKSFIYLQKKQSFVMNCGYNKPLTVLEIIKSFNKTLKTKIKYFISPKREGEMEKIYANTKLLKKKFPLWRRNYSISQSIINMIKWEKVWKRY
jgi:UDP-glucose 4-epimerase